MNGVMKEGSIGSVLFKSQIITEEDIEKALFEQEKAGCRFGEALINLGIVTQEDIDWALSCQLNIPYVRLTRELIDRESATLVPAALARQYNLMPILRVGDELSIVMADPLNKTAIEAVEQISGCRVTVSVGFIREIREMQELFYGAVVGEELIGFTSPSFSAEVLAQINRDMSGGKFFDYLLLFILQNRLSSLSLEPLGDSISVTGRRGGATRGIGRLDVTYYPDLLLKLRKLGKMNGSAEPVTRGELSFRYKQKMLQFQVLMLRALGGDYVTLRPQVDFPFPAGFHQIDLSTPKAERLASLVALRHGMVLFPFLDREERSRFLDMFMDACPTAGRRALLLGESLGRGTDGGPVSPFPRTRKSSGRRWSMIPTSSSSTTSPIRRYSSRLSRRRCVGSWSSPESLSRTLLPRWNCCTTTTGSITFSRTASRGSSRPRGC